MTAVIVTQDGVEVAYDQYPPVSVTQDGVEVAYEEGTPPAAERVYVMWVE